MDTLINFDNLRKVLEEFAGAFREQYRANLVEHDRVTQYGQDRLIDSVDRNTVETMVQAGDREWTVSISLNEYWKYVENGTKPHWPPPSAILRWVQVKPVIPHPDAKGRIPSQKSLAFLIGRKISKVGTTGSHDFEDARTVTIERFREKIAEAVGHDFERYIRKVVAG